MKSWVIRVIFLLCVSWSVQARSLESDIAQSKKNLEVLREKNKTERDVLMFTLEKLEVQLNSLREQSRLAISNHDSRTQYLKMLEKRNEEIQENKQKNSKKLREYALSFESDLKAGEKNIYEEELLIESHILNTSITRIERLLGGQRVQGEIGIEGKMMDGSFIHLGRFSWFKSDLISGSVSKRGEIWEIVKKAPLKGKGDKGEIEFPLILHSTHSKSLGFEWNQLVRGGVWVIPILLAAAISLFSAIKKYIQLKPITEPNSEWLDEMIQSANDNTKLKLIAGGVTHPAGKVVLKAVQFIKSGVNVMEDVVYEKLIEVQQEMEKWLSFIATTAAIAPLLGLLGTVSGMIRMFAEITTTGEGGLTKMSGGISEALITTLFGLIVAIPALILHNYLSRRSREVVQQTERIGLDFINRLKERES